MQAKIKKFTSLFLVLMLVIGVVTAVPITASATETDGEGGDSGFQYEMDYYNEGSIIITGYNGSDKDLVIPGSIDGYTVTGIGWSAFEGHTKLTSVTIPDSVTYINESAFFGCTDLTEIIVSENNTEYLSVDGALLSKDKTEFVLCPAGKKEYVIPDSVTSIGYGAFNGCTALTNITIPDSVTKIGSDAFYNTAWYNNQLDGVVYAGNVACGYKGEMPENTEIVLKDGTLGIADNAFTYCTNLIGITIPDSVINIGKGAFVYCENLRGLKIGIGVTCIGSETFLGCTSLQSVTIPDSIIEISRYAFYGCTALTDINVSENNQAYSSIDGALLNKQKTEFILCPASKKEYTIPNGVTVISPRGFAECTGLKSLTIPDSVINIGNAAFSNCRALTSVKLPDGLVSINAWVFSGCDALTNVTIPESVTSIENEAFRECGSLSEITIPDSVTRIGNRAFSDCTALTSITIPDSVISVGWGVFEDTAWYDNQPEGVVYAGKVAYGYKGEMPENTEIVFKVGTLGIADRAFSWNENLTDITIPDSVISVGSEALDGTAWYEQQPDGVVYAGKFAYGYKGEVPENTEIVLKDGTTGFADRAFDYTYFEGTKPSITSVKMPDSVTSIAYNAFSGCSNLASVTIPKSVTSICDYAFYDCNELSSVSVPKSVTDIGDYALGYEIDRETWNTVKIENFTISGYTGTAAEQYAKDNGFEFIALEPAVVSGDASGDGVVDAKDRMLLSRYLAKWKGYENIDVKAADVNNDGEVNAKDRMILARHLAKWKGYETLPFDK